MANKKKFHQNHYSSLSSKVQKAKEAKNEYLKKYHRDWRPYQDRAYSRKG